MSLSRFRGLWARALVLESPVGYQQELWSDTMARDERRLQLIRLDRWLQARYARRGWARVRVWVEDFGAGAALALLAVLMARSC